MNCGTTCERENAGSGQPQWRPGGLFHSQGCGTVLTLLSYIAGRVSGQRLTKGQSALLIGGTWLVRSIPGTAVVGDGDENAADPGVHQRAGPVPPVLVRPAPLTRWQPDLDTADLIQ